MLPYVRTMDAAVSAPVLAMERSASRGNVALLFAMDWSVAMTPVAVLAGYVMMDLAARMGPVYRFPAPPSAKVPVSRVATIAKI